MIEKCHILHFELLAVALRQHTCVGEWEPATPEKSEDHVQLIFYIHCTYMWDKYLSNLTDGFRQNRINE